MIGLDPLDTSNWNSFGVVFIRMVPVPRRSLNCCCHGRYSNVQLWDAGVSVARSAGGGGDAACRRTGTEDRS